MSNPRKREIYLFYWVLRYILLSDRISNARQFKDCSTHSQSGIIFQATVARVHWQQQTCLICFLGMKGKPYLK